MKTESQDCEKVVVRSANMTNPNVMFAERTTTIASLILALTGLLMIQISSVQGQDYARNQTLFESRPDVTKTAWGSIQSDAELRILRLTIDEPAKSIALPTPLPNITRATIGSRVWRGELLEFSFNQDATEIELQLPDDLPVSLTNVILETAEESRQFPDGRIVLSALDATVEGANAKLESHPGNHRTGFWSDAGDFVRWTYKATRPGKYKLFLTYSVAGERDSPASEIEIAVGETTLRHRLACTGSWYDYRSVEIGETHMVESKEHLVTIKCTNARGNAVMNLKALTLVPTCEGTDPCQSADGSILLHSGDSTIHGTLLQWEPSEKKRTIGYWANVDDSVSWDFSVTEAGKFEVEILQGCGEGKGGSTTEFAIYVEGTDEPLITVPHIVIDTGHWQAFKPSTIGHVELIQGEYRLQVNATKKAANAVMDLRQVILRPVK